MALTRSRRSRRRAAVGLVVGLFVASVVAISATSSGARADSSMYRGGAGLTGHYTERLSLPLSLAWKYTGSYEAYNESAPAIVADTAYFAGGDRFYAVDARTGRLKWRYPDDQPSATRFRTAPVISDGRVFIGATDGKLYTIDAVTGKGSWLFDTQTIISGSPVIYNGVVYFGANDGRIFAVDTKTGVEVPTWKGGVQCSDEVTGAPAIANGMLYALTADQVLHAIALTTGKERVGVRLGGTVDNQSPVIDGDYVFVSSSNTLFCLVARNLAQRWKVDFDADIVASPAVSEDGVFVVTSDRKVYCLDQRTGRGKWKQAPTLDYGVLAPPTISGNTVFIGTRRGGIYAIDSITGESKWQYTLDPSSDREDVVPAYTNVAAAPVVAEGSLFVVSDDGSLCSFRSDAVDTTPPTVTDTLPEMGVVINGKPPIRFEAKITDDGSGVNPNSVKLLIDGEAIPRRPVTTDPDVRRKGFSFDVVSAMLEYDTPAPLSASTVQRMPDGRHTVTVVAEDWRGNTVTKSWTFIVDNSVAASGRKKTVTTNTGYTGGRMGPGNLGSGGMGPGGGGRRGGMPGGGGN